MKWHDSTFLLTPDACPSNKVLKSKIIVTKQQSPPHILLLFELLMSIIVYMEETSKAE